MRHTFAAPGMYHAWFASDSGAFDVYDYPMYHLIAYESPPGGAGQDRAPLALAGAIMLLGLATLVRLRSG